jgi:hypothetical protein
MPMIPADSVGLAEPLNEAGNDDDLAAVALEEAGGPLEPLRGQQHVAAEALGDPSSAEAADREADVVADHGSEEPEQRDEQRTAASIARRFQ